MNTATSLATKEDFTYSEKTTAVGSDSADQHLTILIVDDDPIFRKIIAKQASKKKIKAFICGNLTEAKAYFNTGEIDSVVLDYQLDINVNSVDYTHLFGQTPLLLTSRRSNWIPDELPRSIKRFVPKKYGVEKIIDEAISLGCKKLDRQLKLEISNKSEVMHAK